MGVLQFILGGVVAPLTGLGNNPALSMGLVMAIASISAILSFFLLTRRKPYEVQQEVKSKSKSM